MTSSPPPGGHMALLLQACLLLAACASPPAEMPAPAGPGIVAAGDATTAIADANAPPAGDEPELATLSALADRGDNDAAFTLAERQLHGQGTAQDVGAAIARLQRASESGHAPSQALLASLAYRGIGMAPDFARAHSLLERAADHHYLPAMNDFAWLLSTCPDPRLRDGRRAIELLTPSMDRSAQMLDTLAAAHAETSDFTRAVALQEQAIRALADPADPRLPEFLRRLQSYGAGKPWRDPRDTSP